MSFCAVSILRPVPGKIAPGQSLEAQVYAALVMGVRDYINKNGFPGALIGLSGGVDSALVLAVALTIGRLAHGMVDHYWSRGPVTVAWAAVGMATLVHAKSSRFQMPRFGRRQGRQ